MEVARTGVAEGTRKLLPVMTRGTRGAISGAIQRFHNTGEEFNLVNALQGFVKEKNLYYNFVPRDNIVLKGRIFNDRFERADSRADMSSRGARSLRAALAILPHIVDPKKLSKEGFMAVLNSLVTPLYKNMGNTDPEQLFSSVSALVEKATRRNSA